jgi:hypothetical protein
MKGMEIKQFKAIDMLHGTYKITVDNNDYLVHNLGSRIEFRRSEHKEPFAKIRLASAAGGGTIWIENDCVGEFEQQDEQYLIHPIVKGWRQPGEPLKEDPVEYMFTMLRDTKP